MKNTNLPKPHYCEEYDTLLFVDNNGHIRGEQNNINYFNNLMEPLETFTYASLYYPYEANDFGSSNDNNKHCHSFEELIRVLYNYPQSFKINHDQETFYSNQELDYIKRTQKLLLFYGLNDIKELDDNSRYENSKSQKYISAVKWKFNNQELDKIIKENLLFKVELESKERVFQSNEYTALLLDEDYNVKVFIEFTSVEKKKFKDIKNNCLRKDYNDEDELYVYNYHIVETF